MADSLCPSVGLEGEVSRHSHDIGTEPKTLDMRIRPGTARTSHSVRSELQTKLRNFFARYDVQDGRM